MELKKPDNGPFDVNGPNYPKAKLVMVIDGYAGALLRVKGDVLCLLLILIMIVSPLPLFPLLLVPHLRCSSCYGRKLCRLGAKGLLQ